MCRFADLGYDDVHAWWRLQRRLQGIVVVLVACQVAVG
jgi:hypothetical protein